VAQRITRGRASSAAAEQATRIPAGHPEGYIEAFAQLYRDAADRILALDSGQTDLSDYTALPGIADGVAGHRFIASVLESHRRDSAWVRLDGARDPD
jgi:hypothetical protein